MDAPQTVKMYANGAIYDALGSKDSTLISFYPTTDHIYYLTDTNGTVYDLNFYTETLTLCACNTSTLPVFSVIENDGVVYGFPGYRAKKFKFDRALYIDNQYVSTTRTIPGTGGLISSKLIEEKYDFSESHIRFQSQSEIRDFVLDENNNILIGHNYSYVSKYTEDRQKIYSFNITQTVDLSGRDIQLLALDYVKEYTSTGQKYYPILLGRDAHTTELFLTKIDETDQTIHSTKFLGITSEYYSFGNSLYRDYNLTNYTYLKDTYNLDNQLLIFKFKLINRFNNRDVLFIDLPFSYQNVDNAEYHFAVRFDAVEGNVTLFVNGKKYVNATFDPGKYIFQDILQDSIAVGTTYFYNNIPLFKYLNQNNYFTDNCNLRQIKLYRTALTDSEIRFLYFNFRKITDTTVSLPGSQRNEIESIKQTFKLMPPGHKSNYVSIIVKNSQIASPLIQEQIKEVIKQTAEKNLPLGMQLKDITFKSY